MILTGVYSYTDSGDWLNPSLSNPALNFTKLAGDASYRGVNIEGLDCAAGDGTTSARLAGRPAKHDFHLALRSGRHLTPGLHGPTLASGMNFAAGLTVFPAPLPVLAPSRSQPSRITAVTGDHPAKFYNGPTQIGAGATLQLGDGTAGHDSSLLTPSSSVGTSADVISDDGLLRIDNTSTAITLPAMNGTGAVSQAGPAAVTVPAGSGYTGATSVSTGTLNLAAGSTFSGPTIVSGGVLNLAAGSTYTGSTTASGGSGQPGRPVQR